MYNPSRPFTAIHHTLDLDAFAERVVATSIKPFTHPFFFAANHLIPIICREVMSAGHDEPMEIIFDEHSKYAPLIRRWYPLIRRFQMDEPMQRVAPPEPLFRDDLLFMPLQAADLLAWLCRRMNVESEHRFKGLELSLQSTGVKLSPFAEHFDLERLLKQESRSEPLTPQRLSEMAQWWRENCE